jgi:uncharacterized protein (TIGR03000 family)
MFAKHSIVFGVISAAGLLLAAHPASAQWGPGQSGPNWNSGGNGSGYSGGNGGSYGGYSGYSGPSYAPATTSQSYYATPRQDSSSVLIQMRLPADARVWFDDTPTTVTGTSRLFASPPLAAGQYYAYQVRVQWNDNGKVVDRTRRVTIQAGDRITLDFTSAEASR